MDTVHEENRRRVGFTANETHPSFYDQIDEEIEDERNELCPSGHIEKEYCFQHPPQLTITNSEPQLRIGCDCNESTRGDSSAFSSRRPSLIIAALRRPSQAVALSAAQAVMNQRRYLMGMFHENSSNSLKKMANKAEKNRKRFMNKLNHDGIIIIFSALYAKLLVVLGVAFPITELISDEVKPFYYQGFYLYLYIGCIFFMTYEYINESFQRTMKHCCNNDDIANTANDDNDDDDLKKSGFIVIKMKGTKPAKKYGSFYLRLGAIAFGIGNMVYSGLEFGRYFEFKNIAECHYTALQAITPALRMILTLFQIQFIFLNHKNVDLNQHKIIGRFGLMHMIATNLCEWLYVLVEETKHEIIHLSEHSSNSTNFTSKYCSKGRIMGSLINNASPFLFPCTIEYSLICAVILLEMWKHIRIEEQQRENEPKKNKQNSDPFAAANSGYHFTIDCSNSHKGLFAGIAVIVLTIISLVMFFVLTEKTDDEGNKTNYAEFEVNIVELFLYISTSVSVIAAMHQMRNLKYAKKDTKGIGLDNILLAVAQTGMFIYSMFSIIGWFFTMNSGVTVGLLADVFAFVQTCVQTMFVLDAWWRRCKTIKQAKMKPGRELITFLIIANMAMWMINTLEKNRAEFRPTHLKFFGEWGWTIITHISMPLAIFYRFHSTICLFEVWKTAYKIKSNFKNPLFPVM